MLKNHLNRGGPGCIHEIFYRNIERKIMKSEHCNGVVFGINEE